MERRTREKIIALYSCVRMIEVVPYSEEYDSEGVEVKSLDSLDDNDLYHISEILLETDAGDLIGKKEEVKKMFEPGSSHFWDIGYTPFLYLQVADFLRSRNFAIPAYGYTVEQLTMEKVFRIIPLTAEQKSQMSFGTPIEGSPAEDNSLKKKNSYAPSLDKLLNKNK